MSRAQAEVQEDPRGLKRDLRTQFNELLDYVLKAGPRFTPDQFSELEAAGMQARARSFPPIQPAQPVQQVQPIRPATPSVPFQVQVPARSPQVAASFVVPKKETFDVQPPMTLSGVSAAISLAEQFENARSAEDVRLERWVRGR